MLQLAPLTVTEQFTTRIECQSVFRLLLCNMQFQQHIDRTVILGCLLVDLPQQFQGVNRFDHRDIGCDILHLIGLQMTDEVPLDILGQ